MAPPKKGAHGSNSFATFLIIGPTCFFLGILFACFPYDYYLLWSSAPIPDTYYNQLEMHLQFMHQAPALISRVLNTTVVVGFLGFFIKLARPSEANVLFDGASLILYMIGVGVYLTNIVKGMRAVSAARWDDAEWVNNRPEGTIILGREDSMKVLAASNTILALVMVGVLVLQAGQWYAESKEKEELERIEKDYQQQVAKAAAAAAANGGGAGEKSSGNSTGVSKKKQ